MNTTSNIDTGRTRTETVLAAHECDWTIDWNRGHCACGLVVTSEEEWAQHAGRTLVSELWKPTAEQVSSIRDLVLPERSTVIARPGKDGIVCRRMVLGDPTLSAWIDLTGTIHGEATLSPAVVLERGPAAA